MKSCACFQIDICTMGAQFENEPIQGHGSRIFPLQEEGRKKKIQADSTGGGFLRFFLSFFSLFRPLINKIAGSTAGLAGEAGGQGLVDGLPDSILIHIADEAAVSKM